MLILRLCVSATLTTQVNGSVQNTYLTLDNSSHVYNVTVSRTCESNFHDLLRIAVHSEKLYQAHMATR